MIPYFNKIIFHTLIDTRVNHHQGYSSTSIVMQSESLVNSNDGLRQLQTNFFAGQLFFCCSMIVKINRRAKINFMIDL